MADNVEKAKIALDEIVEKLNRIDSRQLSPAGKALRSSIVEVAGVVKDLLSRQ